MVSWWVTDSYFNNNKIQMGDIELMNPAYGSSVSFESIVRSKYIVHNTYIVRISHFRSKPTPIHVPVHKYGLNYSYLRSHFSWLPQVFSKELMNRLSHKLSYASIKIDSVINGFSPNEVQIHLHICDHSIITFGIR